MTIEELLNLSGDDLAKLSIEELKEKIGPLILQEQALQKNLSALADTQPKTKKPKTKKDAQAIVAELLKQIEANKNL